MAFAFGAPRHGITDSEALCQWKRLHELLAAGPTVVADDASIRAELESILQQIDTSQLFDRDTKEALVTFSSGFPKVMSDFTSSRVVLLRIDELTKEMDYIAEESQSLIFFIEEEKRISHHLHEYMALVFREMKRIDSPRPSDFAGTASPGRLDFMLGLLKCNAEALGQSSEAMDRFTERSAHLGIAMESCASELRELAENKGSHRLTKQDAELKFLFLILVSVYAFSYYVTGFLE